MTIAFLLAPLPVVIPLLLIARKQVQVIRYLVFGGWSMVCVVSILIDCEVIFEVTNAQSIVFKQNLNICIYLLGACMFSIDYMVTTVLRMILFTVTSTSSYIAIKRLNTLRDD